MWSMISGRMHLSQDAFKSFARLNFIYPPIMCIIQTIFMLAAAPLDSTTCLCCKTLLLAPFLKKLFYLGLALKPY